MDDSIGFYVMIALLGAGAAYGMANKGKPKPTLSSAKKKFVIVLFGIASMCGMLLLMLVLLVPPAPKIPGGSGRVGSSGAHQ